MNKRNRKSWLKLSVFGFDVMMHKVVLIKNIVNLRSEQHITLEITQHLNDEMRKCDSRPAKSLQQYLLVHLGGWR